MSEEILGVVLAGGASRRMGTDKSTLRVEGRTLLERAEAALISSCSEVIVSVGAGARPGTRPRELNDLRADCGPLAGLEAALEEALPSGRSVFLLAVDLPFVTTAVPEHVLAVADEVPEADAVVPSLAGRRQPLCALYRHSLAPRVRRNLDAGRLAMHELLAAVEVAEVEIDSRTPCFRPDLFYNLNEPSGLARVAAETAR